MVLKEIEKKLPVAARINNEKNICAANQMEIKLFEVDYYRSNKFVELFSSIIYYYILCSRCDKSSRIFQIIYSIPLNAANFGKSILYNSFFFC